MQLEKLQFINDLKRENQSLKASLSVLKGKLEDGLEGIEEIERRKFTEYYALIGFENGKPMSMGIYHKDEDSDKIGDEVLRQVQLVIPIPDPETLKEFDGF